MKGAVRTYVLKRAFEGNRGMAVVSVARSESSKRIEMGKYLPGDSGPMVGCGDPRRELDCGIITEDAGRGVIEVYTETSPWHILVIRTDGKVTRCYEGGVTSEIRAVMDFDPTGESLMHKVGDEARAVLEELNTKGQVSHRMFDTTRRVKEQKGAAREKEPGEGSGTLLRGPRC